MNERLSWLISRTGTWPAFRPRHGWRLCARAGQATVEYAIAAGVLTAMVAILAIFLYTFREYGGRVLDLVSSDYP